MYSSSVQKNPARSCTLEVGADDSAAVREEVGNDEDSTLVEDGVALGTDGSVRAFDYVLALKQRGVLLADDAFKGAGRKDEAFLLEYLFAVHLDEARLRITVEDALQPPVMSLIPTILQPALCRNSAL